MTHLPKVGVSRFKALGGLLCSDGLVGRDMFAAGGCDCRLMRFSDCESRVASGVFVDARCRAGGEPAGLAARSSSMIGETASVHRQHGKPTRDESSIYAPSKKLEHMTIATLVLMVPRIDPQTGYGTPLSELPMHRADPPALSRLSLLNNAAVSEKLASDGSGC